jgi:hypothetical protein
VLPTPTVRQGQEYATPTVMCPVRAAKARSNYTWHCDPSFLHVRCTCPASRNKYSGYPLEYSVQFEKFVIFAPIDCPSSAFPRPRAVWRTAANGVQRWLVQSENHKFLKVDTVGDTCRHPSKRHSACRADSIELSKR